MRHRMVSFSLASNSPLVSLLAGVTAAFLALFLGPDGGDDFAAGVATGYR